MTVHEVFARYHTPENLQQHMLRVAALAKVVMSGWTGQSIDEVAILQTCLFHDLAKPITFDMAKQEKFVKSPDELVTLRDAQADLIRRFGSDEHPAVVKMFVDIGLPEKAQQLVNNLEWSFADRLIDEGDLESLIPIYCDMRISPTGVISIIDRIMELHSRVPVENVELRLASAERLEAVMQQNTAVNLHQIDDAQLNENVQTLLTLEV